MVARGEAERNPWYDGPENPIKPHRGDRFCRPYGAPGGWFGSVPGVALRSTPGYHRSPLRGYGCLIPLATWINQRLFAIREILQQFPKPGGGKDNVPSFGVCLGCRRIAAASLTRNSYRYRSKPGYGPSPVLFVADLFQPFNRLAIEPFLNRNM